MDINNEDIAKFREFSENLNPVLFEMLSDICGERFDDDEEAAKKLIELCTLFTFCGGINAIANVTHILVDFIKDLDDGDVKDLLTGYFLDKNKKALALLIKNTDVKGKKISQTIQQLGL